MEIDKNRLKYCRFYKGEYQKGIDISRNDPRDSAFFCWGAERWYALNIEEYIEDAIKTMKLYIAEKDIPKHIPLELSACLFDFSIHSLGGNYPPQEAIPNFLDGLELIIQSNPDVVEPITPKTYIFYKFIT